jgi:hypothetical protein
MKKEKEMTKAEKEKGFQEGRKKNLESAIKALKNAKEDYVVLIKVGKSMSNISSGSRITRMNMLQSALDDFKEMAIRELGADSAFLGMLKGLVGK